MHVAAKPHPCVPSLQVLELLVDARHHANHVKSLAPRIRHSVQQGLTVSLQRSSTRTCPLSR